MSDAKLKFDKMGYATALATKFLSEHTKFRGFNCVDDARGDEITTVSNSIGKTILLGISSAEDTKYEDLGLLKKKLWKLSQLIIENTELFCQLEYMIRGIQPDELRAFDLKLIEQNLLLCSSGSYQPLKKKSNGVNYILIKNDSPLVRLASFAEKLIETGGTVTIMSETESAIVCWLFASLCIKAGFKNEVSLCFVEDILQCSTSEYLLEVRDSSSGGCIAIVTGKADIDSAVDVLVDAPSRDPWSLRRVFVQENVLEKFRAALKDRARHCSGDVNEFLSKRSTSSFDINNKIFLIEYAGETWVSKTVVVEAYRTVKDLLSLLGKYRPYALSVWCDSVSESNEIASSVTCGVVWVNTYGVFDGPPQVCQGVLTRTKSSTTAHLSDSFKRARSEWEKLTIPERAAKLGDLLIEHKITDTSGSFYHVYKSFTCSGTEKAVGTVVTLEKECTGSQVLAYLLKGGSFIFYEGAKENAFGTALKSAGAPVDYLDSLKGGNCLVYDYFAYEQKYIWTSYGVTFAN